MEPPPWPGRYAPAMGSSGTIGAAKVAELERQLAVSEAARIAAETRLVASEDARARLERMIAQLRRDKFGTKSEKASPEQQHLPFEGEPLERHKMFCSRRAEWSLLWSARPPQHSRVGSRLI